MRLTEDPFSDQFESADACCKSVRIDMIEITDKNIFHESVFKFV